MLNSDGTSEWENAKFRMEVDANLTFGQWIGKITEGEYGPDNVQGVVVSKEGWGRDHNPKSVELKHRLDLLSGPLDSDHITIKLIPKVITVDDAAPALAPGAAAASSAHRNAFDAMREGQQRLENLRAAPRRKIGSRLDYVSFRPFSSLSPMSHLLHSILATT